MIMWCIEKKIITSQSVRTVPEILRSFDPSINRSKLTVLPAKCYDKPPREMMMNEDS